MSVLVNPNTLALGKAFSRSVDFNGSVLAAMKWHRYEDFDEAGVEVSSASIDQLAATLAFLVNAADDTGISSYTGASAAGSITYADANANTIQKLIDIVNGVGVGQPSALEAGYMTRWRAGLGDFRPGFALGATSGVIVAPESALLGGDSAGLLVKGSTAGLETPDLFSVGVGTGRAKSGGGQVYADHFESDYKSDTSGNRFPVRDAARRREEQPGLARYAVAITEIRADMAYASDAKVVTVYDIEDKVVASFPIGAGTTVDAISAANPLVGPSGSPLFVECVGVGALQNGPLSVSGDIRIA